MPAYGSSSGGSYGTVSIGTSAVLIATGRTARSSILVQNVSANNLYLARDANVTASNGIKLASGDSVRLDDYSGNLYGIADGASSDVRFMEVA